jgi:hypothetical protein
MECKTFEILDRATLTPVLAIRLEPSNEQDRYLLTRAGYEAEAQGNYVLLCQVDGGGGRCTFDCYEWKSRTYRIAHDFATRYWHELPARAVVEILRSEAECSPLD